MKLSIASVVMGTAAVIVGFAAPVQAATPLLNGTYDIDGGDQEAFWQATSTCATEGCTAQVASNVGWSGVATMRNGRWNLDITKPDGVVCADGNYAPIVMRYSLDPVTLAGTLTADSNGECPGGQVTQVQFTAKKIG